MPYSLPPVPSALRSLSFENSEIFLVARSVSSDCSENGLTHVVRIFRSPTSARSLFMSPSPLAGTKQSDGLHPLSTTTPTAKGSSVCKLFVREHQLQHVFHIDFSCLGMISVLVCRKSLQGNGNNDKGRPDSRPEMIGFPLCLLGTHLFPGISGAVRAARVRNRAPASGGHATGIGFSVL